MFACIVAREQQDDIGVEALLSVVQDSVAKMREKIKEHWKVQPLRIQYKFVFAV